ncbi:hypothetical protein HMPREF9946_02149 [Acetobacteraceae bacterium AT-5844]|nr:hypothetical protein HMPREF9946_02149 [Acetobacteraceae bacterium AT-5844]
MSIEATPPPFRVAGTTEHGWTIYEHRGARILSSGVHNRLEMPEHPFHGKNFGNPEHCGMLIDHWLDHGKLPKPYVWPVPEKKR